ARRYAAAARARAPRPGGSPNGVEALPRQRFIAERTAGARRGISRTTRPPRYLSSRAPAAVSPAPRARRGLRGHRLRDAELVQLDDVPPEHLLAVLLREAAQVARDDLARVRPG